MEGALNFITRDIFIILGDAVYRRKAGWLMGGSMSEAGALSDLGADIHDLYNNPNRAQDASIHLEGYSVDDLVQGLLYVDDSLVVSKVYCSSCLCASMRRLWPSGVGVSCEAQNPPLTCLQ
eukprot:9497356-Pyramimonas_sp.AAC.1